MVNLNLDKLGLNLLLSMSLKFDAATKTVIAVLGCINRTTKHKIQEVMGLLGTG